MKHLVYILACFLVCTQGVLANGAAIIDASQPVLLQLDSSVVSTTVEGQISVTTATQYFRNTNAADTVKYGFPLYETATPLGLRWRVGGVWYTASVAGVPQDTTLPGGGNADPDLLEYLGPTPLYFDIPQAVDQDSTLAVELTYVELLPYQFGTVSFEYRSDYRLIQSSVLVYQQFDFFLNSQRTIDSLWVESSHPVGALTNDGDSARVQIILHQEVAAEDLSINYNLNPEELGLFDYSTMMPDSLVPDSAGNGFLTFIAEPDPQATTETIAKVFTLIVDRSGSMSGSKIVQARDAASFIVENLNEGDLFNVVDFASTVSSFRTEHVEFTPDNMNAALDYIAGFIASGSTNISGAFDVAVPQFSVANDSTANIIVFFTDGYPTAGITETNALVAHIDNLIDVTETDIFLFTFGIGGATGEQLLTLM
ncbi:MAG: VIT and VWA domain-containing protein, partial [Ignavibacteria bacterium]|nr:VIT and VWA domain-containing protein [Ignavibacteria bacterium]